MGLATPFLTFLHPFIGPANQGSGSSKQVVVSSRGKEMGFKWWGLTLEDSCREKTHRREPPLLVSLAPPLLALFHQDSACHSFTSKRNPEAQQEPFGGDHQHSRSS